MNLQPFIEQWLRHNSWRNPGIPTRKTGIPPGFLQEYVGQGKELSSSQAHIFNLALVCFPGYLTISMLFISSAGETHYDNILSWVNDGDFLSPYFRIPNDNHGLE